MNGSVNKSYESQPPTEDLGAEELIEGLFERFGSDQVRFAISFQKESSVICDIALSLEPKARLFTLDTGVLFEQTHSTWKQFEEHFGTRIESYSGISLAEQAELYGNELWEREPERCCTMRKVAPLKAALEGAEVWVTGLRREQSDSRRRTPQLAPDPAHGLLKAAPLAGWSEKDVWRRIASRGLPYHPLHDRGYGSIGCQPCTVPGQGREGRWQGSALNECGLHPASGAGAGQRALPLAAGGGRARVN